MTHTVHRWNRLCCIHQLSGCSSVCVQPTSCKHVLLNCLNIVWKMTDKRAPPIGAFKLNPLKTPDKISAKVDETTQICDSDITNIENMDKDTGGVDIKPDSHMVKQTPNKASVDDAYSSAFDGVKSVERADSGVMMKMIVSGPPSQVKRQKILPETLLQKVTDLVRQQTMNQDVSIPGEMKDKLLEEDANENIKHTVSEKDTEELKRNSMPCLNTQENVIAAQNSNQYISQPIAQSVDNKLCDSEFTHTANVQYSEQTKDLRDKESLTNMNETYTLADGESCVRLDSCVETGDSFTNKMLEKNRGTKLTERIEKEFEALEGVDEICGPPRSDEPGSAEVKKGKTQMNVNETEISTLGHLTSDGVGDVSDKTELNKEACTKCISDNEIDPFGGLFPENETDSPDDKKAPKDNDEIYNIAPLFSGNVLHLI